VDSSISWFTLKTVNCYYIGLQYILVYTQNSSLFLYWTPVYLGLHSKQFIVPILDSSISWFTLKTVHCSYIGLQYILVYTQNSSLFLYWTPVYLGLHSKQFIVPILDSSISWFTLKTVHCSYIGLQYILVCTQNSSWFLHWTPVYIGLHSKQFIVAILDSSISWFTLKTVHCSYIGLQYILVYTQNSSLFLYCLLYYLIRSEHSLFKLSETRNGTSFQKCDGMWTCVTCIRQNPPV